MPKFPDVTSKLDIYLRRIVKLLESNAVVDPKFRQKVIVDAVGTVVATGLPTECTTTLPISGSVGTSVTSGGQGPTASFPTLATTVYQPVWEGPVDQRWRVMEDSHISYQVGIRSQLVFS